MKESSANLKTNLVFLTGLAIALYLSFTIFVKYFQSVT